jgi:hypothetical protein
MKMKLHFSTSNRKILYIPVVCRKNSSQRDCTDWRIITIEGEEKVIFVGVAGLLSMFWNSIEIRCIDLQ